MSSSFTAQDLIRLREAAGATGQPRRLTGQGEHRVILAHTAAGWGQALTERLQAEALTYRRYPALSCQPVSTVMRPATVQNPGATP